MVKWILCSVLTTVACSTVSNAAEVAKVSAPGGGISVSLDVNGEGRISYAVSRNGTPVLAPSGLGFLLADAPKLERNFAFTGQAVRSVDETWEQPWGEWRSIRNRFNELRATFKEKTGPGREISVVFRVYDDGVGFRTEFPDQPALRQVNIQEELTQFNIASPGTAWWIPAIEWNREEYLYNRTPIAEVGHAQTPMTVKLDNGLHIAFHEAALVDYSAMNLQKVEGSRFKVVLSPAARGPKVSRAAPFATPWRTLQIALDAAGLYQSQLVLNLNEPNALGDVSWVKPRKYMGIWWGMHLDVQSWASGPKHGATTGYAKRMIDFASKHGFSGLLVEGWNVGWDGDWFGNGETFSFTQAYPDFDIEAVTSYGRRKGVTLIGHHETSGNIAHYEDQLAAGLDLYQRLGVDSVKTGYVADAGGLKVRAPDGTIGFEWHEGQASARHHLKVVTEAAKRRIMINAHEPIKDSGLRRTYPNWISREGARGMEYSAWGNPTNPPEHEATLVFTRMLAGPMDYTPGIVSLKGRGGIPILTTLAKQLALYVVLYSPIQMAADLPEHYEQNPRAFQFIKDVAVDWDDTRVLNGEVGDYVTIARKERGGEQWFLGSLTDENPRTLQVPLNFLTPGIQYRAQIYKDGPGADYKANPFPLDVETRTLTSTDTVTVALAPGGGQAIRFTPVKGR